MLNENGAPTACETYARIIKALETQLKKLDEAGAFMAAAHLDAAIQQLRRDRLALELATAAHHGESENPENTAASEALARAQVFPRKANPAHSR